MKTARKAANAVITGIGLLGAAVGGGSSGGFGLGKTKDRDSSGYMYMYETKNGDLIWFDFAQGGAIGEPGFFTITERAFKKFPSAK